MLQVKKTVFGVFIGLILALFSINANAVGEAYTFDPMHTSVTWHANHFGFSNPSGKWFADGTLMFDESAPQKSQVNTTIQIASLDTGIPKFTEHLLSNAFFDAPKFPTATFVSKKIVATGKNTYNVTGLLTLHGQTNSITLTAVINKAGIHPFTKKKAVGFSATGSIYRSDFGMTTYIPGISDKVELNIEAEAEVVDKVTQK